MKLQCQVEIINRTHCSLNLRTNSKFLKSTLALGKEPKRDTEFFILHFSTVNKSGTKYPVKNIKQVFVKCINEGKSTIRFDKPPHDLCIKSESIQLKCFMRLLNACLKGDAKALQLGSLSSLSVTAKDNAPTKLIIHDRSEFPNKGLPRTLEHLSLCGLQLSNFRREILLLKHLTVLKLSDNEIEKIPAEFGRMPCLTELYLANNQLGNMEDIDWRWLLGPQITKTLQFLDLSGNKLDSLPKAIWKLQKLVNLKLDNNLLKTLPATMGRIKSLRYLTVSQNNLESLPIGLAMCNIEHIDISGNKFRKAGTGSLPSAKEYHLHTDRLVNLAAAVVLKHDMYYAPSIIPKTLVEFLDDSDNCVCGAPTVNNISFFREINLKEFFSEIAFDVDCYGTIEVECFICSHRCLNKVNRTFITDNIYNRLQ